MSESRDQTKEDLRSVIETLDQTIYEIQRKGDLDLVTHYPTMRKCWTCPLLYLIKALAYVARAAA